MELAVTWREIVERKLNTCKTTQRVDGLARTTKPKASPTRTTGNKTKARARAKSKGKGGKDNEHDKKGKKGFDEMKGHEDKQETKTGQ